jgi:hypothetical protein
MKAFNEQAAQGDILVLRIAVLPAGLSRVAAVDGRLIIGHSENGGHHVMEAEHVEMYRLPEEIYECFIVVKRHTPLVHLRGWDTHESIMHEPGIYQIRRQREFVPEGWRRVQD